MEYNLFNEVANNLSMLESMLKKITNTDYCKPNDLLEASIGEHTRHVLELYLCLLNKYEEGTINYDKRERNKDLQTNKSMALDCINYILHNIDKENKLLTLEIDSLGEDEFVQVNTNYNRELLYNIEHTIHHLALIKIGLKSIPNLELNSNFGVAPSTIKYREKCAQ